MSSFGKPFKVELLSFLKEINLVIAGEDLIKPIELKKKISLYSQCLLFMQSRTISRTRNLLGFH
jgi:hypothetical protein